MNSNQVALITGATGGIGSASVRKLLASGLNVCATDISLSSLQMLESELKDRFNHQLLISRLDVTQLQSIEETRSLLLSKFGKLDILINNAGTCKISKILDLEEDLFLKTIDVNLLGPFRVCKVFVPELIKEGRGKVIQVASIAALKGAPGLSHYAATKAALIAFSNTMAIEFASRGIQVNTILPGYIETPMTQADASVLKTLASFRIPSRRLGNAEEVADLIQFLALTQASYLTGSQIVMDGGLSIG